MKVRLFAAVVLVIQLVACGGGEQAAVIEKAQGDIVSQLKDPASAQFRNVVVSKTGKGFYLVCGEVNARNAYGGYVGFKPFIWREGSYGGNIAGERGESYDKDWISALCSGRQSEYLEMRRKQVGNDWREKIYIYDIEQDLKRFNEK
ncbi:MAG: hypothetical protein AB7E55_00645 [Pigmentiphaga sp.]